MRNSCSSPLRLWPQIWIFHEILLARVPWRGVKDEAKSPEGRQGPRLSFYKYRDGNGVYG